MCDSKPLNNLNIYIDPKSKFTKISNYSITKIIKDYGGSISYTINQKVDYIVTLNPDFKNTINSSINKSNIKLLSENYFLTQQNQNAKALIQSFDLLENNSNGSTNIVDENQTYDFNKSSLPKKIEDDPLQIINNPKYIPSQCYNPKEKQPFFPEDYLVLKFNLLTNTYISNKQNVNKFFYLELNQATDNNLKQYYRIYTQFGRIDEIQKSNSQHRYTDSLSDAMNIYSSIYSQKIEPGSDYKEVSMDNIKIGSKKRLEMIAASSSLSNENGSFKQKVYNEETGEEIKDIDIFQGSYIDRNVCSLIQLIFKETSKCLIKNFSVEIGQNGIETQLGTLSLDQINVAQSILKEINKELVKSNSSDSSLLNSSLISNFKQDNLEILSSKFFQNVPSKISTKKDRGLKDSVINNMQSLIQHYELLEMMKDLTISFNSKKTEYQSNNHLDMKYYSLNTDIRYLHPASSEYKLFMHIFREKEIHTRNEDFIEIVNVFRLEKEKENKNFNESIGNCQYLFHGTNPSNIVGILSKGLLLPDIITSSGGKRSDFGYLGKGIYFSEDIISSLKFIPGTSTGTSLIIVSYVALGNVKEYTNLQPELTSPPKGYDSCKGIKSSDFKHNEHVIYNSNQSKLSYLLEFKINNFNKLK
ncbi:hypothetical protein DICPUDRAFT_40766 [Dictyostelium purpureum]|uniref:Poly [ADP-ribose] polymerase n=1 Tax=Dictyostelium purpureum TaxID=5786 RepID=F0ZYT3_DICPU|nr:uncharacterized protein DICPUDRAFT_40766 [Dictyostelium purpureum]EGC30900.1 hypothetical protein DICPUDRAFT_40766 [Dictyostelium purpureum]|eukprot:XP_003292573.1 hypothetical protein DICPUDRAFT_40766 [Dictyostelium purpureum]